MYWKENEFQSLVSIGGLLAPTFLSGAPLQRQLGMNTVFHCLSEAICREGSRIIRGAQSMENLVLLP